MKMTKKILLAAVAAITVVGFTGCDFLSGKKSLSNAFQKKVGDSSILGYSDNSSQSVWTIEGENESTTDYVRALQILQTKHSDMAGLVQFDINDAGVIGVVFNESRVKDDDGNWLYSFALASVGKSSALPYYYVSYFANVKEEDLPKDNFGVTAKKDAIDPEVKTPYEIVYKDLTSFATNKITDLMYADEKTFEVSYKVAIDVKEADDGSYTIKFYGKDVKDKSDFKDATTVADDVTISAASLGKEEAAQGYCGCYAMINRPGTLNGSLTILHLTHEATPVEE